MRKTLLGLLIFALFVSVSNTSFAQPKQMKIGVVDMEVIAEKMPEAKAAQEKMQEETKKFQDTLLAMQKDLEERFQKYQKQKGMMKPDEQQKEEAELTQMNARVLQYREQKVGQGGELIKMQNQFLEPVRLKIRKAIEEVAKEEKISYVFDTTSSALLYFDEQSDITFIVLDRIKRGGTGSEEKGKKQ